MTRKEHLIFCKKCLNRKYDSKQGIICNLTQKPADFKETCESFSLDPEIKDVDNRSEEPVSAALIDSKQGEQILASLKYYQDFNFAVAGGLMTMLVSAVVWAVISVVTKMQIGFMAIGVGYLVGNAVRYFGSGVDKKFGILGAVLSMLGCVFGNLFAQVGFIAQEQALGYFETLNYLNFSLILQIMAESFSPMDLLFYGIAIYEGYRFAFRKLSNAELLKIQNGEYDGLPANQKFKKPLVISSVVIMALFIFTLSRGNNGFKTYYYESGQRMYEGEIKKNRQNGPWTYWYENGSKQLEANYVKGSQEGNWKWYNTEGILIQDGLYKDGLENGQWKHYYDNGSIMDSGRFENGRQEGFWKGWNAKGQVSFEGNYHLDKPEGKYTTYHENGNILSTGNMHKGEMTGTWYNYFEDGSPESEITYRDKKPYILNVWLKDGNQIIKDGNGEYVSYYGNGRVSQKGKLENGIKVGIWKEYSNVGALRTEYVMEDDIFKIISAWDIHNNHIIINGEGDYVSYYPESDQLFESGKLVEGKREGEWITYGPGTGKLQAEQNYETGHLNGPAKLYFESGELQVEGTYKNDKQTGIWNWYFEDGTVSSSVEFIEGKKTGIQEIFNEFGEKTKEEIYENGELKDLRII
ncbi:toxin-antitoxin system YwqK family antitoxin [Saccharicrinis sp. FJH62]|uniref:toxin-antitoxin system YwqK family antitoxin n=1 Tax=Saccharicrinis sp. FJH62 TaxID=3344657 RepID=UPI0035D5085F